MKVILLIVVFSLLGCAADTRSEAVPAPKSELHGVWRIRDARIEESGLVIDWEFSDTEVIVWDRTGNETEVSRSRYFIDATKCPMWITVEIDDSPDVPSGDKRLGIYRIQDGELHLKQEIENGGKRPASFEGGFTRFERVTMNQNAEQRFGPVGESHWSRWPHRLLAPPVNWDVMQPNHTNGNSKRQTDSGSP